MSNQYVGTWRIVEMEQWDQDFIDLVVPGYIAFREDHRGEFHFGAVHGDLDYRIAPSHDAERLECSWEGDDEMDSVSGRGWAILGDGQLRGSIYVHEGDESGSLRKKRNAQTGGAVETRFARPVVVDNLVGHMVTDGYKPRHTAD